MQRNVNQNNHLLRIFRSQVDSRLIIDEKHVVLTIASNQKPPYQAIMYVETLCKDSYFLPEDFDDIEADDIIETEMLPVTETLPVEVKYKLLTIEHFSKEEYSDDKSMNSGSTRYKMLGPGIVKSCLLNRACDIEDKWCYTQKVSRDGARKLYNYLNDPRNRDQCSRMNSRDFFIYLLRSANLLTNTSTFLYVEKQSNLLQLEVINAPAFFYVEKKPYLLQSSIDVWNKYKKGNIFAVDNESEIQIATKLLSSSTNQINLTPEMQLQCLFKAHTDRSRVIDWNSNLGKNIQFLQDRLGIFIFSYANLLKDNLLTNTNITSVLLDIIIEYVDNENNRTLHINACEEVDTKKCDEADNKRSCCSIM